MNADPADEAERLVETYGSEGGSKIEQPAPRAPNVPRTPVTRGRSRAAAALGRGQIEGSEPFPKLRMRVRFPSSAPANPESPSTCGRILWTVWPGRMLERLTYYSRPGLMIAPSCFR